MKKRMCCLTKNRQRIKTKPFNLFATWPKRAAVLLLLIELMECLKYARVVGTFNNNHLHRSMVRSLLVLADIYTCLPLSALTNHLRIVRAMLLICHILMKATAKSETDIHNFHFWIWTHWMSIAQRNREDIIIRTYSYIYKYPLCTSHDNYDAAQLVGSFGYLSSFLLFFAQLGEKWTE